MTDEQFRLLRDDLGKITTKLNLAIVGSHALSMALLTILAKQFPRSSEPGSQSSQEQAASIYRAMLQLSEWFEDSAVSTAIPDAGIAEAKRVLAQLAKVLEPDRPAN
jgi:hypothetical protein